MGGGCVDGDVLAQSGSRGINPPFVHAIAVSHDGRRLAAGLGDGTVPIHELDSQDSLQVLGEHADAVCQVHAPRTRCHTDTPASHYLAATDTHRASASTDCDLRLWNALTGEQLHHATLDHKPNWLTSHASPNRLFVAHVSPIITLYRLQ